jgi:hypothetical protein
MMSTEKVSATAAAAAVAVAASFAAGSSYLRVLRGKV